MELDEHQVIEIVDRSEYIGAGIAFTGFGICKEVRSPLYSDKPTWILIQEAGPEGEAYEPVTIEAVEPITEPVATPKPVSGSAPLTASAPAPASHTVGMLLSCGSLALDVGKIAAGTLGAVETGGTSLALTVWGYTTFSANLFSCTTGIVQVYADHYDPELNKKIDSNKWVNYGKDAATVIGFADAAKGVIGGGAKLARAASRGKGAVDGLASFATPGGNVSIRPPAFGNSLGVAMNYKNEVTTVIRWGNLSVGVAKSVGKLGSDIYGTIQGGISSVKLSITIVEHK